MSVRDKETKTSDQSIGESSECSDSQSSLKVNLNKLIKDGSMVKVFAVAIKQTKTEYHLLMSANEKLSPIRISLEFLEKKVVSELFPSTEKRASWEIRDTKRCDDTDKKRLVKTMLNFDSQNGSFDDILYRVYTRKINRLSLEECKKLYFAKIKTITNVKLKSHSGIDFPFELNVYVMLKQRKEQIFSPIITIAAIITPSKVLSIDDRSNAFIEATVNGNSNFEVFRDGKYLKDFENLNEFLEVHEDEVLSIDDILLFVFQKYFIKPLNDWNQFSTKNLVKSLYVRRSRALDLFSLVVPYSKISVDPLGTYLSPGESNSDVGAMSRYILGLLDLYSTIPSEVSGRYYSKESLIERSSEVRRIYIQDYSVYYFWQKAVELFGYEKCKESTDLYHQPSPDNHNYNSPNPLWRISWDIILYSFIASEDLLFASYDQIFSELSREHKRSKIKLLKEITERALDDFEEYYDLNITAKDSPFFLFNKREYDILKDIHQIDKYYNTLLEKQNLLNSQVAEEQRRNERKGLYIAIASLMGASIFEIIGVLVSSGILKL